MTDDDLRQLYSKRILALAAAIPHAGKLAAPQARVKKRAPLCGSTVTVDLAVEAGQITAFAQTVRACALGQASASVLGAAAIGADRATIAAGRDALLEMLTQDGPIPPAPFDGLEVLRPAAEFKNRHASILLAWEATLDGLDEIAKASA